MALSVAFVPLLAWNIVKVARQAQAVREGLRLAIESAASVDDQMKAFLRNTLRNTYYGVAKCYAFGSVVGQHPTRDLDIVVQFDSSKEDQVRTYRDRLRSIEGSFQEFSDLQLHVQTFLSSEDEALHGFLDRAGKHERLK